MYNDTLTVFLIYSYDAKLIVMMHEFSLFQSSVSHDPSEIILICWFAAQETFLIIINVENSCTASYFCGNCYALFDE